MNVDDALIVFGMHCLAIASDELVRQLVGILFAS